MSNIDKEPRTVLARTICWTMDKGGLDWGRMPMKFKTEYYQIADAQLAALKHVGLEIVAKKK